MSGGNEKESMEMPYNSYVLTDLCRKIYGENFIEYEKLEQELGELRKGGWLQYKHLKQIKKRWPLFEKWYTWPSEEVINKRLQDVKISFTSLDGYEGRDQNYRIEKELFDQLYTVFKHSELVSIILRFVDPDHFGIYSPPIVYYLDVDRGVSYKEEYVNYLAKLREFQHLFEQEKAAYTDMTIWALTKSTQYEKPLDEDGNAESFKSQVDWVKQSKAIDRILPDIFRNKTYFELAEVFYRYHYYDLAAVNGGKAFEEAVIKKCKQVEISVRKDYDNNPRPLFDLVNDLSSKMRWKGPDLHQARKIRNDAAHPTNKTIKRKDVKLLLDVIRKYFFGLSNEVRIQKSGENGKGEMVVTYREFADCLKRHYKKEKECPTLGGRSNFFFRYDNEEKIAYIRRSTGRIGTLEESQLHQIFHRYVKAPEEMRNQTGYYTDPKWSDTPDRILAPYVASLLRFWWQDTMK